jgi:hypothetical protein
VGLVNTKLLIGLAGLVLFLISGHAIACILGESPSECHDRNLRRQAEMKKKRHSEPASKLTPADQAAIAKANLEAERWRRELPDPQIGITTDQVRAETNWGSPDRVHSTTTAVGAVEQWAYGIGGRYLYFRDGVLFAIQK